MNFDGNKIPLSFEKFNRFIESKKYELEKIYKTHSKCKFIELKTPHYCKHFFVHIPSRYFMETTEDSIPICKSDKNKNQEEYISLLQNINSLVCISNSAMYHFDTTNYSHFTFGEEKEQMKSKKEIKNNVVFELEQDFKKINKDMNTISDIPFVKKRPTKKDPVELIFEDEEGNEIQSIENIIDTKESMKIYQNKKRK